MTVFLQVFVLAAACYLGLWARAQLQRALRRRERRRAWRQLDTADVQIHVTPAKPGSGSNKPERAA